MLSTSRPPASVGNILRARAIVQTFIGGAQPEQRFIVAAEHRLRLRENASDTDCPFGFLVREFLTAGFAVL